MFFDLSSMQPAEQIRARDAAIKFIDTQMTASDMVSIMTLTNELRVVQDFTNDRETLLTVIQSLRIGDSSELAALAATGADATDDSGEFTADDTEFNIFNTDRKLSALEDATRKLAPFPEKKALVYFSSGIGKTGVDNQSQIRATVNAAVRANVSFYPIDARGLVAMAPAGDATQASPKGTGVFTGSAQTSARSSFHDTQDTIYTLAADTGGKALARQQRPDARHQGRADRYQQLLRSRLLQRESGAGRQVPPRDGEDCVAARIGEDRLPQGLLRRQGLGQDEFERQGAATRRRAHARRSVHRSAARDGGGLLPDRARQILRPDYRPHRRLGAGSFAEIDHGSGFHRPNPRSCTESCWAAFATRSS